jgi:hypothetical protein
MAYVAANAASLAAAAPRAACSSREQRFPLLERWLVPGVDGTCEVQAVLYYTAGPPLTLTAGIRHIAQPDVQDHLLVNNQASSIAGEVFFS